MPQVMQLEIRGVPKVGIVAKVKLEFSVAVNGTIGLGRVFCASGSLHKNRQPNYDTGTVGTAIGKDNDGT